MTITGHGESALIGCFSSRSRPIPHFTAHLRAVNLAAQFGKAAHTDIDVSAPAGKAGNICEADLVPLSRRYLLPTVFVTGKWTGVLRF